MLTYQAKTVRELIKVLSEIQRNSLVQDIPLCTLLNDNSTVSLQTLTNGNMPSRPEGCKKVMLTVPRKKQTKTKGS